MLKAFIDDSGSGGDSEWFVLAGYIGTVEGWDAFDAQWLASLNTDPKIGYFKASEAESLRHDSAWRGITPEQRDQKIDGLIRVISRCARRAICARMRQRDYDDFIKGQIPSMWDSPYYFLQTYIIGAAINIERIDGDGQSIDFVFDFEQRHQKNLKHILPALQGMDSYYGSLVNVAYRDDQDVLPLQAADLLAWQIRRFFSLREPRRTHFDLARLSLSKEPHTWVVDRLLAREMIEDMRKRDTGIARSRVTLGGKVAAK